MSQISNYIATQSASGFVYNSKIDIFNNCIANAKKLQKERIGLDQKIEQSKLLLKMMVRHQNLLKKAGLSDEKLQMKDENDNKIYKDNTASADMILNASGKRRSVISKKTIENLLKDINKWGIEGYKVITTLRKTVTGQELIYHIQDSNHKYSYVLNEDEYIKLLENNKAGMSRTNWSAIKKAVSEGFQKVDSSLLDLFQLNVGATGKKPIESAIQQASGEKRGPSIYLEKDALYQYLITKDNNHDVAIRSKHGGIDYSRIAELHSQLLARYQWQLSKSGGGVAFPTEKQKSKNKFFFTDRRQKMVDAFTGRYKTEKLHRDRDTFYESGDATLNEDTLIENKVGKATVSISTIRKAIDKIANLEGLSKDQLKQSFINLFTTNPKTENYLTKMIQDGAKEKAIKSINDFIDKNF